MYTRCNKQKEEVQMNKLRKAVTIGLVLATMIPSSVGAATVTKCPDNNVNNRYSFNNILKREDVQKYIASIINAKNGSKQDTAPKQDTVEGQKEAPTTNTKNTEDKKDVTPATPSKTEEKKDTSPTAPSKTEDKKDTTEQNQAPKQNSSLNAFEQEVIHLTNQERQKNGLAPFKANIELSSVARAKSQDMIDKNYFDHQSPTYGSPFDMMKSFGISYRTAGENIAKGQKTAQQVVNGWMNSEGHRKNILNPNFTEIGVGYAVSPSGTAHWTQMFIG